jgi:hypothetical protein
MKGYVRVTTEQLRQAISGFGRKYAEGKVIRDKGIELFYHKHYVNGSWLTRLLNRKRTRIEFVRNNMSPWGTWADTLHSVLSEDETDLLNWWCWTGSDKVAPLKTLLSQSSDGFALVDNEMAAVIENYGEYK